MEKNKIRILAALSFLLGTGMLFLFFPPTKDGFGFTTELFYSILGFIYIILGLGLFFLFKIARLMTIIISAGYLLFLGIEICREVITDKTGQSLPGLFMISPIILLALKSIIYLTRPKVKEQFK